jgi:hypothetical protein
MDRKGGRKGQEETTSTVLGPASASYVGICGGRKSGVVVVNDSSGA